MGLALEVHEQMTLEGRVEDVWVGSVHLFNIACLRGYTSGLWVWVGIYSVPCVFLPCSNSHTEMRQPTCPSLKLIIYNVYSIGETQPVGQYIYETTAGRGEPEGGRGPFSQPPRDSNDS